LKAPRSQSTNKYSNKKASQTWLTTGFTAALSRDGTAGAGGIAQAVADGGEFREAPENRSEQGEDGGAFEDGERDDDGLDCATVADGLPSNSGKLANCLKMSAPILQ